MSDFNQGRGWSAGSKVVLKISYVNDGDQCPDDQSVVTGGRNSSKQPFADFLQDGHGRQGEQGHDKAAAESQHDAGPGSVMGTGIPQHQAEDERDEG